MNGKPGPGGPDLELNWLAGGLVPAVVQDAADRRVLMVGYMDAEALAATLATGDVHFHSRSRDTLWRKGETSGNVLRLRGIEPDCDADALLVAVDPSGPTCHRGTRSCFDGAPAEEAGAASPGAAGAAREDAGVLQDASGSHEGFAWLEELWATIEERGRTRPAGSYTARLLDGGVDAAGRKVTEEATEVLIAAKDHATAGEDERAAARAALVGEAADLAYHALVLLAERGVRPAEVIEVLRARHSGSRRS